MSFKCLLWNKILWGEKYYNLSLILYWRAACDILTASQIQKKRQSRPSRKICVFWSFKLLWLSLIFLGTCYHMPPPPNIFRFCGVEVPILFGNDLLWNSLPYSKGFVMSGCQTTNDTQTIFWMHIIKADHLDTWTTWTILTNWTTLTVLADQWFIY